MTAALASRRPGSDPRPRLHRAPGAARSPPASEPPSRRTQHDAPAIVRGLGDPLRPRRPGHLGAADGRRLRLNPVVLAPAVAGALHEGLLVLTSDSPYYHGGLPGLPKGAYVLPPSTTGARCASDYGARDIHRRDRVYVTTSADAAIMFAALHPSGVGQVYEVAPSDDLEADPDCSAQGLSFQCSRARILRVIRPHPLLMERIRREVFREELRKGVL